MPGKEYLIIFPKCCCDLHTTGGVHTPNLCECSRQSILYTVMEDTRKPISEQMTESDKTKMMSDFSNGLTLWGSNKVVKKWLKYRKASLEGMNPDNSLLLLEDIIYEIRKDVGQRKKLGKGDMLSIFINDVEKIIK